MVNQNRVAITGLGAVTPIGIGVKDFWDGLVSGRNGVAEITHFDVADYRSKLAAEVQDFDALKWIDAKSAKRMDRFTQFGLAASAMAMEDAGLATATFDRTAAGVIIGSGIGGVGSIEEGYLTLHEKGPKSFSPFFISKVLVNMAAASVSIKYGFKGPLSAPSVACSTGAVAIGDAFRLIQRGDAQVMITGSSEACINPLPFAGFCASRSMSTSTDPETASRPFDRRRDGFIMGEGGGIAILENLDHAQQRGARIYAELVGYGNAADAFHITAPDPEYGGMVRVMEAALRDAGSPPEALAYINAHGTSTVLNDKCESSAILKVFGEHAWDLKISSIKSMIGHLMAASGAVEFIATVMSVFTDTMPPTIHYGEADPDCPLDYLIHGALRHPILLAMTNSFGFGGGNASLVIKKWQG
ncbi:MAG: beta-ketoacyl-ACP synthase II [Candidatus Marinimicrobia bacterium]|nr:beta-ketoacyl-ACP synthase II [Candidatus Neomarinimicrobiota bacterium]